MAPLDVVQAEAEVATRRQTVAQAEATWRTVGARAQAPDRQRHRRSAVARGASTRSIGRRSRPSRSTSKARSRKALDSRTDLEQARKTIDSNDVTLQFLQQPDAAGARPDGQLRRAGPRRHAVHPPGQRPRQHRSSARFPGGYGDALEHADRPRLSRPGTSQLNLSYPIGGSAADAQLRARARAAQPVGRAAARARAAGGDRRHQRGAAGRERPEALRGGRRGARSLAQTRLEAEQSRFDVGLSTNFFVVQAQRDLATAQNSELRALLDYRRALVDYRARAGSAGHARRRHHHRSPPAPAAGTSATCDDRAICDCMSETS